MGNLRSVAKACEQVGFAPKISSAPKEVQNASVLILPGVGAFAECVSNLKKRKLFSVLQEILQANDRPFLGICLGLQLLFSQSEEGGKVSGLGLISGKVRRFSRTLKVPHMGWNQIQFEGNNPLFAEVAPQSYLYFVHSYFVDPDEEGVAIARTDYGKPFVSAIQKGNIYATQFHPEKSQEVGLKILKNFKTICEKK